MSFFLAKIFFMIQNVSIVNLVTERQNVWFFTVDLQIYIG